ncbi:MAG: terminase [Rhodospirillaceae bacterium]
MADLSQREANILEAAGAFQFDPYGWASFAWKWGEGDLEGVDGPREWQADIMRAIRDHLADKATRYEPLQIAVASGHGIGKSALMGMLSNWGMSCFDDAKIVTTANTDAQLRTKTAPEIGKWFRSSVTAPWFKVQAQSVKVRDGEHEDSWRQDFIPWSEHNTEAFAGLHNKGKIIILEFDEASKIHDKVWEVAEGALTDENTIIIWIVFGNPTRNSGRFRECFRRFRHRWITRQIDSRTVPGTNKKKIQQWLEDHGEDSDFFKIRVRGQFPSQSALQFIGADDVDKARARSQFLRPEQYQFAPVIIGVDPAWTGDDSLEIMLRQGLYSKSLASMPRNDNDVEVANLVARLEDDYKADAVFVDGGYGTGIVSCGTTLGRNWQLVWFSGKPIDPGYMNKRAEMWGGTKAWLKAGGVIDPHDEVLYQDLIGPETVPRLDGKIQLESKEDMKDRGLPSPGKGDALGLTFAAPVAKKQPGALGRTGQVQHDYDPYA